MATVTAITHVAVTHTGPPAELDAVAREAGLSPELVARLVRLGLLEPFDAREAPARFPRDAAQRLARAVRLRRDLGLTYSSAVLVSELLERIDDLEARLRRYEPSTRQPR